MSASHLTRFLLLPELKLTDFKFRSSELFYRTDKESEFEVCPKCATPSYKVHDRREVKVKDAPEPAKPAGSSLLKDASDVLNANLFSLNQSKASAKVHA